MSEPLVTFFNKITEITRLATVAYNPYSDMQQAPLGIQIMKGIHDFETGIREWYARLMTDHTWINVKSYFKAAQVLLRQI